MAYLEPLEQPGGLALADWEESDSCLAALLGSLALAVPEASGLVEEVLAGLVAQLG
jgi:hypothetical protein